jgi:hypothetical protein
MMMMMMMIGMIVMIWGEYDDDSEGLGVKFKAYQDDDDYG